MTRYSLILTHSFTPPSLIHSLTTSLTHLFTKSLLTHSVITHLVPHSFIHSSLLPHYLYRTVLRLATRCRRQADCDVYIRSTNQNSQYYLYSAENNFRLADWSSDPGGTSSVTLLMKRPRRYDEQDKTRPVACLCDPQSQRNGYGMG